MDRDVRHVAVVISLFAAGTVLAEPPGLDYRSALGDYQRFSEDKAQPWKDANDNVRRIGGWREYARESSRAAEQAPPAASAASRPAVIPAAPERNDGHR